MSKTDPKSLAEHARNYKVNRRTIYRWRDAGAPLADPEEMRNWLAGRKNLPASVAADDQTMPGHEVPTRRPATRTRRKLPQGAAAALLRLEESEARAFTDLEAALLQGDLLTIRPARKAWLDTATSLARFDKQIEQNRRDAGALIHRSEVEAMLRSLGYSWRCAIQRVTTNVVSENSVRDPAVRTSLIAEYDNHFISALALLASAPGVSPSWAVAALTEACAGAYRGVPEAIVARAKVITQLLPETDQ